MISSGRQEKIYLAVGKKRKKRF